MLLLCCIMFMFVLTYADQLHIVTCLSNEKGSDINMNKVVMERGNWGSEEYYTYKVKWLETLVPWQKYSDVHISNICGKNVPWEGFKTKPKKLLEYVNSIDNNDIVLFTDATDVVFNIFDKTPEELIRRFKSFHSPIVTMAEPWCWVGRPCTKKDMEIYYSDALIEKSSCPYFLNSGAYIGYASAVRFSLNRINEIMDIHRLKSDQAAMTMARHNYPWLISIDRRQKIFSGITSANLTDITSYVLSPCIGLSKCGINMKLDDEWTTSIRKIKIHTCNLYPDPLIIHANGPTDKLLSQFWSKLKTKKEQIISNR